MTTFQADPFTGFHFALFAFNVRRMKCRDVIGMNPPTFIAMMGRPRLEGIIAR